jgi:hypothetical protein
LAVSTLVFPEISPESQNPLFFWFTSYAVITSTEIGHFLLFLLGKFEIISLTLVCFSYTQELERIKYEDILALCRLWILAGRALIPKLQNTTIDALYPLLRGPDVVFRINSRTMKRLLDIIFGEKREEHPILRSLLVDHFASLKPHQLNSWAELLPPKVLVPLTKALCKDREDSQGKKKSVLATSKKATDYYVEIPTEKKIEEAKPERANYHDPFTSRKRPRVSSASMLSLPSDRDAFGRRW